MQRLVGESSSIGIYGGAGGNGGGGGVQGGPGGPGLGPSVGGVQFVIQNLPTLDNAQQLAANAGLPGPSQAVAASSRLSAPGTGTAQSPHASPQHTSSSQVAIYSESRNYCSHLLRQGRGFPLYVPGPKVNLPPEYRRRGIAIGDVGRVNSEGSFDFFFNIYLPANHPINAYAPEDFVPLSPYDPIDVYHHEFEPGDFVSSPSVTEISSEFPEFPGGEFAFSCREPTGAVLTLPHGAHLEKLENLESMRRYAAEHAESWYKYVNGTRGRGLVNGNLYLVTGCEKPQSWGMASFHDVSLQNEFQLLFRPTAAADSGYRYRWQGIHCRRKQADPPLDDETPPNQTTFIHAFAISVGERIWEKLFGVEVCQPVDSSTFPDKSGRSFVPYGSQGSSSLWSFFTGGSAYNGGRQAPAAGFGNGIVTDAFPTPKIFHPSEIIHERIFREVPQATVVITHDDDWCDLFKDDGLKTQGQTLSELQQALLDRFQILEEDGAVFLKAKSDPTTSRNAATATVEELRPIHGHIDDCTREGDNQPNSTDNFRIHLDPATNLGDPPSPHSGHRERLSAYSDRSEPSSVDEWGSPRASDYDVFEYDAARISPVPRRNNRYGSGEESKDHSRDSSDFSIRVLSPPSIETPQLFQDVLLYPADADPHVPTNLDLLFPGSPISTQSCSSWGPHTTRVPTPNSAGLDQGFLTPEPGLRRTRSESSLHLLRHHQSRNIRLGPMLFSPESGGSDFMVDELSWSWPLDLFPSMRRHRRSKSVSTLEWQRVHHLGNKDIIHPDSPLSSTEDAPISRRSSFRSQTTTHSQLNPPFLLAVPPTARPDDVFLSPDPGLLHSSSDATSRRSHVRQLRSEDMRAASTLFSSKSGVSDLVQKSQFLSPVVRHQRRASSGSSAGLDDGFFYAGSGSSRPKSEVGLQPHLQLPSSRIQAPSRDNLQMGTEIQQRKSISPHLSPSITSAAESIFKQTKEDTYLISPKGKGKEVPTDQSDNRRASASSDISVLDAISLQSMPPAIKVEGPPPREGSDSSYDFCASLKDDEGDGRKEGDS
ncbi:Pleiotropic drug resistance ABC transporter protein [Mycena sanguinolenta]|uniref:Pleiotropic drug resistance ABC transporter protein n=1 Tax=Mycena sanguinolenta TaxID=230812 RepID=A0A8H7DHE1_9AGAR|nr:Pleiotropic drug resistance ABC transporter protein [Mycena sanguinolenta]